ncbi:MAG: hypothetical protein AAF822_03370 [Pseudomonadota bacterium]
MTVIDEIERALLEQGFRRRDIPAIEFLRQRMVFASEAQYVAGLEQAVDTIEDLTWRNTPEGQVRCDDVWRWLTAHLDDVERKRRVRASMRVVE